jgi:hypothetical protein
VIIFTEMSREARCVAKSLVEAEVESWRVKDNESFGLLTRSTLRSSSEERVHDSFRGLQVGFQLRDTISDSVNGEGVLDTAAGAHGTLLDDANIAGAVSAAFNEAGGRSLGVVVVAYEEHVSTNLELAALPVGAKSDTICGVNGAHLATIDGTSEIKELVNRLGREDISRVVNAPGAEKKPSDTCTHVAQLISVLPSFRLSKPR